MTRNIANMPAVPALLRACAAGASALSRPALIAASQEVPEVARTADATAKKTAPPPKIMRAIAPSWRQVRPNIGLAS